MLPKWRSIEALACPMIMCSVGIDALVLRVQGSDGAKPSM